MLVGEADKPDGMLLDINYDHVGPDVRDPVYDS